MKTSWRVNEVTARRYENTVKLERVEWYKKNPAYDAETMDSDCEFLDVPRTDPDAELLETGETITFPNLAGFRVTPDDIVEMELTRVDE